MVVRKHKGIHQQGPQKGKLKKGYRYNGKKTKTGKAIIVRSTTVQHGGKGGLLSSFFKKTHRRPTKQEKQRAHSERKEREAEAHINYQKDLFREKLHCTNKCKVENIKCNKKCTVEKCSIPCRKDCSICEKHYQEQMLLSNKNRIKENESVVL